MKVALGQMAVSKDSQENLSACLGLIEQAIRSSAQLLVLQSDRDWLAGRIARRFHLMIEQGALDEVRAVLPFWDPDALWAKAIGAPELVAHLQGQAPLDQAIERAIITSRQYAKAQRSFFRGRMRDWPRLDAAA